MQQGDYTSAPYYHQFPILQNTNPNPNPNPPDPLPNPYASAPPFTSDFDPTAPPSFDYQQPPSYYPPYDQHQTAPIYSLPPSSIPNPHSSYNTPAPYAHTTYDNPDHVGGAYFDDCYGGCVNRSHSDSGYNGVSRYEPGRDEGYGDGVYSYEGGKVEPYGTAPKFDDYGRSISFPSPKQSSVAAASNIVKAEPKVDAQQGVQTVVQKFRVKLLPESGDQNTVDVLCQIGLDGIRMLYPNTSLTLRIYPLENITRCDRLDSSTFAFWSKSPVDIEPRRIRLQSNSYTTNTLLDTVTAATIQFKEMYESRRPAESLKTNEKPTDKKKAFGDWMNLIKPANEEKDHWVPDEAVSKCTACGTDFGAFIRKHHCRNCGDIFCDKCTHGRIALTADENAQPVRVCDRCMAEVTQRLSSAKESSSKPVVQSHEDLARKLQEELERNLKASGSVSDGSERRLKEVACPICTVHLQVQVPSSGSETIECGVCQHPFLVSAH